MIKELQDGEHTNPVREDLTAAREIYVNASRHPNYAKASLQPHERRVVGSPPRSDAVWVQGGLLVAFEGSRAEYYRGRARMIRALAEKSAAPDIKQEYERIAQQYDQLANEVEVGQLKRS